MPNATLVALLRKLAAAMADFLCFLAVAGACQAQVRSPIPVRPLTGGGEATLEADQQRQAGKIFYADGHVDMHYQTARLRADHVEYDSDRQVVLAKGNVELD